MHSTLRHSATFFSGFSTASVRVLNEEPLHSDDILISQAFSNLLDQFRRRYDYIIMDLPPIAPIVDVRATAPVIGSLIFVVEWGTTRIKAAQRHVMAEPDSVIAFLALS